MTQFTNGALTSISRHKTTASLSGKLLDLLAVYRQRRQLAALDAHLLQDIGVTPAEAMAESRKLTWDAPERWRC